jgi:hypothetical protein
LGCRNDIFIWVCPFDFTGLGEGSSFTVRLPPSVSFDNGEALELCEKQIDKMIDDTASAEIR